MPGDRFYRSPEWRRLRARRLEIDRHTCVTPGCGQRATVVDHIKRRRDGGADSIDNLRSLCVSCDNRVKEAANGRRKSGGVLRAVGCDANGIPRDPGHPWHR